MKNNEYEAICRKLINKKKEQRVPSVKKLLQRLNDGEIQIIYSSTGDIEDGLTIFSDGSVVYGNGIRMTVFAIVTVWYHFHAFDKDTRTLKEEYITDPEHNSTDIYGEPTWLHYFTTFGEKRLSHNETSRVLHSEFPVEDIDGGIDYNKIPDRRDAYMDLINEMYVDELLSSLNDKQREIIIMHFWDRLNYEEIAGVLNAKYKEENVKKHASRQSVKQMADRALEKMRSKAIKENCF